MNKSPKISIIDDDPSIRVAIDDLLKSSGYLTSVFSQVDGFLSSSAAWESDCVISDYEMQGTSGIELLRVVRSNKMEIPVIVMSARAMRSAAADLMKLGAFAFIEKPFSPERFLELVHSAVSGSSRGLMGLR
ncbi:MULTISPECIES: response regulator [unclassified Rhizobium]|uniref:response regulator n=1 Tax=unclassified Rhizobium TaxID=2613769 RepID=UPI001ADA4936|nr:MULTISPECIES: response regulator [unclassified Rhizobium]MBO9127972.1 response regulator [Rhizobium sp. 16-488-2b]MBO9178549.1 response regulator [Rhizobium sp. 16-488-2a]